MTWNAEGQVSKAPTAVCHQGRRVRLRPTKLPIRYLLLSLRVARLPGARAPGSHGLFYGGNEGRGEDSVLPLFLPQKKDKIGKKGCFFYGIFIISHQRHQPRQRVRHHRARLHDGLRHRQNAELRPRRRHHGRRLHLVLRDVLSGTAQHRSRPARGRRLYGARHCDRASGLQAAALGAQPRGAYHRHRRELLPAKLRPAHLEGRRACRIPPWSRARPSSLADSSPSPTFRF